MGSRGLRWGALDLYVEVLTRLGHCLFQTNLLQVALQQSKAAFANRIRVETFIFE